MQRADLWMGPICWGQLGKGPIYPAPVITLFNKCEHIPDLFKQLTQLQPSQHKPVDYN